MSTRLSSIDGLRGLAILAVVYQHNWATIAGRALKGLGLPYPIIVTDGWMGVGLFFLLSGFVLSLPFIEGSRQLDRSGYERFVVHRLGRLWPLLTLGCLAGLIASIAAGHTALRSFLLSVTTLNNFTSDEFFATVFPVGWSLSIEVWASLLLPIALILTIRFGWTRVLLVVLALALATRLVGTQIPFINFDVRPLKDALPARFDDFMVGAFIAHLYARQDIRPGFGAAAAPLGIAAVVTSCLFCDAVTARLLPEWSLAFLNNLNQLGFGLLLVASLTNRAAYDFLAWAPLRIAGVMCFSIYVWHAHLRGPEFFAHPLHVRSIATYLALVGGVSLVSFKFIEFPNKPLRTLFAKAPFPGRAATGLAQPITIEGALAE